MRARQYVALASALAAIGAILLVIPLFVEGYEGPCMPVGAFTGKAQIDRKVDEDIGGCFTSSATPEGADVQIVYAISDAEYRNEPAAVANIERIYDELYGFLWRTVPYRIARVEMRTIDFWGGKPRLSTMSSSELRAKYGPRSPELDKRSPPLDRAQLVRRYTQLPGWVITSTSVVVFVTGLQRLVRRRRAGGA